MNRRNFIETVLFGGLGSILYGYVEPYNIIVENVSLNMGYGLKILFLTDLHLHGVDPLDSRVLNIVKDLIRDVDIAILGGDQYDEYTPSKKVLKPLLDVISGNAFYINGNHEYWSSYKYGLDEMEEFYQAYSIESINNRSIWYDNVKIGGLDWIFDDGKIANNYFSMVGNVDILISHTPDSFRYIDRGYKLMLAGHTHGGQIFRGLLYTNSRFGYTSGLYRDGDRLLYVSRGAGEMFPLRLLTPREITIVEI